MGTVTQTKVATISKVDLPTKNDVEKKVTLKMLKDAIPPSCFESSVPRSFAYLLRDIAYAVTLVALALQIDSIENSSVRFAAWTLYTVVQGFVFTGLWIIGHECGHGGFSKYPLLNNVVGWAVHSSLMVPYFSWQISHARHHRYHGNMEKDTVFVPATEDQFHEKRKNSRLNAFYEMVEDTPAYTMINLIAHQLAGWQFYLLTNASRGSNSLPANGGTRKFLKTESHFDPWGALFTPSQTPLIVITDLGLMIMGFCLYVAASYVGWEKVTLLYVIPYFWVHHWLIAITYLHHTHPAVPHFTDARWNFTDGALATIDRNLGFVGRHFFHEIIDYHVVHHLFPKIPFYEAEKATKAIIPLLGERYHDAKDEFFLTSLLKTFHHCTFVSDNGSGIMHWASLNRKKSL